MELSYCTDTSIKKSQWYSALHQMYDFTGFTFICPVIFSHHRKNNEQNMLLSEFRQQIEMSAAAT